MSWGFFVLGCLQKNSVETSLELKRCLVGLTKSAGIKTSVGMAPAALTLNPGLPPEPVSTKFQTY